VDYPSLVVEDSLDPSFEMDRSPSSSFAAFISYKQSFQVIIPLNYQTLELVVKTFMAASLVGSPLQFI
jgi:hypothetical protein